MPEPVRPTMATVCPGSTAKETQPQDGRAFPRLADTLGGFEDGWGEADAHIENSTWPFTRAASARMVLVEVALRVYRLEHAARAREAHLEQVERPKRNESREAEAIV